MGKLLTLFRKPISQQTLNNLTQSTILYRQVFRILRITSGREYNVISATDKCRKVFWQNTIKHCWQAINWNVPQVTVELSHIVLWYSACLCTSSVTISSSKCVLNWKNKFWQIESTLPKKMKRRFKTPFSWLLFLRSCLLLERLFVNGCDKESKLTREARTF